MHLNDFLMIRTLLLCTLAALPLSSGAIGFSIGNSSTQDTNGYTTNRPWGNLGPVTPAPQYQPPQPMLPGYSYYPGAAPETGWYTPAYPSANTANAETTPTVEQQVSDSRFYEQQHGIYTVRIVSNGNIATLEPSLPDMDGAVLEPIDGPVMTTRYDGSSRTQQIVNSYRYRLTPLHAGDITIPPIRFTGTWPTDRQSGQPGAAFTVETRTLTLGVRAADPAVQPWLPLHNLSLQTRLQPEGPVKAGQPVTLTVELSARGAQGNQLPSLSDQIQGPGFRVYRDATKVQNGVGANDRYLTGSRTESYTLIPLEDGWVHLPNLHVSWWDVDLQQAALAGIADASAAGRHGLAALDTGAPAQFTPWFWAPMVIALTLILGYVLGAWDRSRRLLQLAGGTLQAGTRRIARRSSALAGRYSPLRLLQRLRPAIALLMPRPVQIWMCTRCLATETDPNTWCAAFKTRVCQHLGMSSHAPLTRVAEAIITTSPRPDPDRLRILAQRLDAAVYGGEAIDFVQWKRELQQQLRPRLMRHLRSRTRRRHDQLPTLNPQVL